MGVVFWGGGGRCVFWSLYARRHEASNINFRKNRSTEFFGVTSRKAVVLTAVRRLVGRSRSTALCVSASLGDVRPLLPASRRR